MNRLKKVFPFAVFFLITFFISSISNKVVAAEGEEIVSLARSYSGLLAHDDFSTDSSLNYNYTGTQFVVEDGYLALESATGIHKLSFGGHCVSARVSTSFEPPSGGVLGNTAGLILSPSIDSENGNFYLVRNYTTGWDLYSIFLEEGVGGEQLLGSDGPYIQNELEWNQARIYNQGNTITVRGGITDLSDGLVTLMNTSHSPRYGGVYFNDGSRYAYVDDLDIRTSHQITVDNLPDGYYVLASDGTNTAKSTPISTFGADSWSGGTGWHSSLGDVKFGRLSTLPHDGAISKITALIAGDNEYPVNAKALIYRASDESLIATSEEVAMDMSTSLWDFPFATPVELTAGDYWLVIHADAPDPDGMLFIYSITDEGTGGSNSDDYSDGSSDPLGFTETVPNTYYINATYTNLPATATGKSAIVDAGALLFPLVSLAVYDGDPDNGGNLVARLLPSDYSDMGGGDIYDYGVTTVSTEVTSTTLPAVLPAVLPVTGIISSYWYLIVFSALGLIFALRAIKQKS